MNDDTRDGAGGGGGGGGGGRRRNQDEQRREEQELQAFIEQAERQRREEQDRTRGADAERNPQLPNDYSPNRDFTGILGTITLPSNPPQLDLDVRFFQDPGVAFVYSPGVSFINSPGASGRNTPEPQSRGMPEEVFDAIVDHTIATRDTERDRQRAFERGNPNIPYTPQSGFETIGIGMPPREFPRFPERAFTTNEDLLNNIRSFGGGFVINENAQNPENDRTNERFEHGFFI